MVGAKLKELRIQKGFTIAQLCEQVGLNKNTYAKYERNERDVSTDTLSILASFYNVSADYLLGREVISVEELNPILQLTQTEMEQQLLEAYFSLPQKLRDDFIKGMADELERRKTIQPKRHTHEATIGELQDAAAEEAEAKKDAG